MSTIRQGWNTEQVRNESFREVLSNSKYLSDSKRTVLEALYSGPKTLQEISGSTGMKEHLVAARLNDLRKEEFVRATGERKFNPLTKKNNSLWEIDLDKFYRQLEIFSK